MGYLPKIEDDFTNPVVCVFCGWKGESVETKYVYGKPNENGGRIVFHQCPDCFTIETIIRDSGQEIIPIKKSNRKRRNNTK